VCEAVEEYHLANTQAPGIPTLVHGFQAASWCAPSRGWIKVNWDAGLDWHQDLMGVGLIAHDEEGCVKATMCYLQKYVLDPTEADAFGARLGAEFARFMGFSSIVLEGDSQKVVRRMRREMVAVVLLAASLSMPRRFLSMFMLGIFVMYREEGMERPIILRS